jgi:hypothetical protein
MQDHWDAASYWPYDEIADALRIEQSRDWMRNSSDDEVARFYARERIIAGALQMTASRLVGQRTQETVGDSELWGGVNEIVQIRAEQARKHAAAARASKPTTQKVKVRKRAPSRPKTKS